MAKIPTIDGHLFSWTDSEGAAMESDLRDYDMNSGFYVRSHKSGNKKLFLYADCDRDNEGDIMNWNFFVPGENITIKIFND